MVRVSLMASELSRNRKRTPDDFYTPFVMSSTADVKKQGSLNESWRIVVMMKHRPPYFLSFFNMIITKIGLKRIGWPSTVAAVLAVFALAGSPAVTAAFGTAQASPNDPQGQIEALGRRFGMTPAEVEALERTGRGGQMEEES